MRCLLFLLLSLLIASAADQPAVRTVDLTPVARWINGQRDLRSISADFTQTRSLKALRNPQSSAGRLWFRAPDFFRWELGQPVRSILLRRGEEMWLISPKKKKATRMASDGASSAMEGMAMLKFPIAASLEDFKTQFEVLDLHEADGVCVVSVLPRDVQARKFLQSLEIAFETGGGHLRYFEVQTKEGSVLRNDFQKVLIDQPIEGAVFDFDFAGYAMSDAKK